MKQAFKMGESGKLNTEAKGHSWKSLYHSGTAWAGAKSLGARRQACYSSQGSVVHTRAGASDIYYMSARAQLI